MDRARVHFGCRCRYIAASVLAEHLLLISWLVYWQRSDTLKPVHSALIAWPDGKRSKTFQFSRPPTFSRLPSSSVGARHLDTWSPRWTLPLQTGSCDITVYHSKEFKVQMSHHSFTLVSSFRCHLLPVKNWHRRSEGRNMYCHWFIGSDSAPQCLQEDQ